MNSVALFNQSAMPQLQYSVVFNPVQLTSLEQKYVYHDEVIITNNIKKEIIAYNRRLMCQWYLMLPDIGVGERFYYPEAKCGDSSLYGFDDIIFPIRTLNGMNHLTLTNNMIYQIYKGIK